MSTISAKYQFIMVLQILIVLYIFFLTPSLASPLPSPELGAAKPGCVDHCGNISIPYPFGTTQDCFLNNRFRVTCNESDVSKPPKLFSGDGSLEMTSISLEGQVRYLQYIAHDCYNRDGKRSNNSPWLRLSRYFTVNNTANVFTVVGCDTYAYVSGHRLSRNYSTACIALCDAKDDLTQGPCSGVGCCKIPLPANVSSVNVDLRSFKNYSAVWEFNNCGYAFLVEETAFSFSPDNLTNLRNVERLPIVVDWAFGNETCEVAQTNSSSYACVSPNSGCYKPENGYGYRCRCSEGYRGNPYLNDGCKDINECADRTRNNCTMADVKYCMNFKGSYTCSCPKGYSGDGRGPHGCIKKQDMKIVYVLIGTAFGITALLFVVILLYMEHKRRSSKKMRQKYFHQNGGMLLQEKLSRRDISPDMVRIFSSSELKKATNNFHSNMIVGKGGFGVVYKGKVTNNTMVAIKKSRIADSTQIEPFINEVFILSQINHRNVVRLLGCCLETEVPLLVYEFINNGTLSAHIHNKAKTSFFNWETRLRIAAETADVLSYLHSAASTPIIHRDVKPDNILIDDTFAAKVSDFGASRLVPQDLTHLTTMVQGTHGYLDPEYFQTSQLTEKSDVYSFGVVLLVLLTSRKAISFDKTEEEKSLAYYFLSMLKQQRLFEILDENIVSEENIEQMSEVARIAKECLNVKGEDRPSMKQVAMELEGMRVGGKHSRARNVENAEEIECVLDKDVEALNTFANVLEVEGGSSTSVRSDSIRGHFLSPISGGR